MAVVANVGYPGFGKMRSRNLIPETAAKRYKSIPSSRPIRGFEPIGVAAIADGSP
jgi:hypothetical protein